MQRFLPRWIVVVLLACTSTLLAATHGNPATLAAGGLLEDLDLRRLLAPFHSVVLHYPIGLISLAFLLELWSLRNPSRDLRRVIVVVVGLGALTAVLSAVLGLFRAAGEDYEAASLNEHKWYGLAVTAASLVALGLVLWHVRQPFRRGILGAYRIVLAGSVVVLIITGHLGGNLTHGSNYLLEGAPSFIKAMLMQESYGVTDATPTDEHQRYFVEQIRPVFEAKCYSCHGPEKQRGGYRLDVPEAALRGGDSGETAIKPGDPAGSYLVKLILLPADHDDVMPPAGKLALSAEEIGRIIHWIRSGAVFATRHPASPAAAEPAGTVP
jgi:uncharacterized membrane protein